MTAPLVAATLRRLALDSCVVCGGSGLVPLDAEPGNRRPCRCAGGWPTESAMVATLVEQADDLADRVKALARMAEGYSGHEALTVAHELLVRAANGLNEQVAVVR